MMDHFILLVSGRSPYNLRLSFTPVETIGILALVIYRILHTLAPRPRRWNYGLNKSRSGIAQVGGLSSAIRRCHDPYDGIPGVLVVVSDAKGFSCLRHYGWRHLFAARVGIGFAHFITDRWVWKMSDPAFVERSVPHLGPLRFSCRLCEKWD